jgi:hypothetical protein
MRSSSENTPVCHIVVPAEYEKDLRQLFKGDREELANPDADFSFDGENASNVLRGLTTEYLVRRFVAADSHNAKSTQTWGSLSAKFALSLELTRRLRRLKEMYTAAVDMMVPHVDGSYIVKSNKYLVIQFEGTAAELNDYVKKRDITNTLLEKAVLIQGKYITITRSHTEIRDKQVITDPLALREEVLEDQRYEGHCGHPYYVPPDAVAEEIKQKIENYWASYPWNDFGRSPLYGAIARNILKKELDEEQESLPHNDASWRTPNL